MTASLKERSEKKIASRFLQAATGEPTQIPPGWMMRQAGRYQNRYRELRQKHSFVELCKNASLSAATALAAVDDFDFDAAILFSDLLFPLEALGMGLEYDPSPKLAWRLSAETAYRLKSWSEAEPALRFQAEAILETKRRLSPEKSLLGFVGGPFTLFVYAVEGTHQGPLRETKAQFPIYKTFSNEIVPLLRETIFQQLRAGADLVYILDTAGGELSPENFHEICVPPVLELAAAFPGKLAYYSRGVQRAHLEPLFESQDLAGIGVDHRWPLLKTLQDPRGGFLQGNFDPALLALPLGDFERQFRDFLVPFEKKSPEERRGWICGLGHGVLPGTPETNVRRFVEIVREVFA